MEKPTAEQVAAEKVIADKATADAAAAAAAAGTKTPEQLAADKATADAAALSAEAKRKADDAAAEAAKSKAPEKYALKLPESGTIDAADLARVEKVARANNYTNEQAQALLDEHAGEIATMSASFLTQTKADPTYGGDHFEATQKFALAALDKLRPKGTPAGDALRGMLNKTGYGNHLAVISLLADIGKQMAEDDPMHSSGGSGAGGKRDAAAVLYGEPAKV